MLQALYTAANGMVSQQQNLDVIGSNVSNINTNGFKRARFDFKDALYQRMKSPVDNSVEKNLERGTGAIMYQVRQIFQQGAFNTTDRGLDLALDGEGFLSVQTENGTAYTRGGSLYVSAEDRTIVTAQGYPLLDESGEPIVLPDEVNDSQIIVSADGIISLPDADTGQYEPFVKLDMVTFLNAPGLSRAGDNLYLETENSGPPEPVEEEGRTFSIRQGAVELSNVDYSEEVTRMIRAQRAYQFASRCIQAVDQMQQTCNSIRS